MVPGPNTPSNASGSNSRLGAAQRRTEEIYQCLRDRICLLQYPPGTRLSEQRLADEFSVSRTPIRRALHQLEHERLAERRQGVQTIVTDFDFESVRDIYAIRMILAESIEQLSPAADWWRHSETLRQLRARCEALRNCHDLTAFGTIHLELQQALSDVIENTRAREIMMQLYFQIARIWLAAVPSMDWEREVDAVISEIDGLVDAMEHRDIRALGLIRRNAISMNIERMRALEAGHGPSASYPG